MTDPADRVLFDPDQIDTRAFYRAIGYEEFFTDANLREQYGAEMLHFRKRIEKEP